MEPFERLGVIVPLRVDRGVLVGRIIAAGGLKLHKLGFRISVPSELFVHDRQTLLTFPFIPLRFARGARSLKVPRP
jgi:hypothetical protein